MRGPSDHNPTPLNDAAVEGLTRAAAKAAKTMAQYVAATRETYRRMEAMMDRLAPPEADPEPLDPRERALWARRNRNTGPARNPHRHRGRA